MVEKETSDDESVELSGIDRAKELKKHNTELIKRLRIAVAKRRVAALHRDNVR